ncbi:MAG: hypothetical protein IJM59_09540 [Proteobacteria bacterium]|nr:hypothetical protein [Pseudomonadota bacterium]
MTALLLSFIAAVSCSDEIVRKYESYAELCKDSGGTYQDGQCKCKDEEKPCDSGVICINGKCANSGQCRAAAKRCRDGISEICGYTGEWLPFETCNGVSCNEEGGKCGECLNDSIKCDDAKMWKCKDGRWVEGSFCPHNECMDEQTCSECESSSKICTSGSAGKNATYIICNQGKWSDKSNECGSSECSADKTECAERPKCTGDLPKCEGNILNECQNDTLIDTPCEHGCDEKNNRCNMCHADSTQCINGKYSECIDGQWGNEDSCDCRSDRKTCRECKPNEAHCKSENILMTYQVCDDDGQWHGTDCPTDKCDDTTGCEDEPTPAPCINDTTKCENNQEQTCVNGQWQFPNPCGTDGCDGDKCKISCRNEDTTKCESGIMYKCEDNTWKFLKNCDNAGCDGNKCKEEPTESCSGEGITKCENNQEQTCQNGQWQPPKPCAAGCDGEKCKETKTDCIDGQTKCSDNGTYLMRCDEKNGKNGEWHKEKDCTPYNCFERPNNESYCAECDDGPKCQVDNSIKNCKDGKWSLSSKHCPNGCNPQINDCYPDCNPNNKQVYCEGKIIKNCNGDGAWGEEEPCIKDPDNCKDIDCGSCTNNKIKIFINKKSSYNNPEIPYRCINSSDGKLSYWEELKCGLDVNSNDKVFTCDVWLICVTDSQIKKYYEYDLKKNCKKKTNPSWTMPTDLPSCVDIDNNIPDCK